MLLFEAWFPFDWENSNLAYYRINVYQCAYSWIYCSHYVLNDTYPGAYIRILQALMHVLDHKTILEYCDILQKILSKMLFLHLFNAQVVICTSIYTLVVSENYFDVIYGLLYIVGQLCATVISCYYGSELIHESDHLTLALYSRNWMDQNSKFRKTLIIFMQRSLVPMELKAGGLVLISLSTLLSVVKSAYSLLAFFEQLK